MSKEVTSFTNVDENIYFLELQMHADKQIIDKFKAVLESLLPLGQQWKIVAFKMSVEKTNTIKPENLLGMLEAPKSRTELSDDEKERIARYFKDGLTQVRIAKELNIPISRVIKSMRERKLNRKSEELTAEQKEIAVTMFRDENATLGHISYKIKASIYRINKYLMGIGLRIPSEKMNGNSRQNTYTRLNP